MDIKKDYNTKARKHILDYLESKSDTTVSVGDIMEYLKSLGENVNHTTVYRYLNKLNKENKVLKFTEDNGQKAVYQIRKHTHSCDGHIHIQCTKCGKLLHLDCDFMEDFKQHLKESHDFTLKCESSLLYGICSECSK